MDPHFVFCSRKRKADLYDLYGLYDHVVGWDPYNPYDLERMFPRFRLPCKAYSAQPLTTAGGELL